MAKLNTYVHVDGTRYGPDDELSDEVARKITNPDVWADGPPEQSAANAEPGGGSAAPVERPRGNASRDAWAEYASRLDPPVDVTDAMGRDEIAAAVDAREL